ncbi:HxlR family transcriptional regulator [Thermosporothrix hazakensis]|jgi:DNA-binding HxlR family transcriptional regulator|uniref:HxlR family transcriptional regulator n=2 Tax=Thermosporothrix TaxID=768650 RepID=A0A326U3F5_THEHA|nr:helix-turn-helix domain-containing protein [Thermosporothrix hazakensis]PZW25714.1 HxlR family transcriptional regulator [Thermosporothrix hazakensis]BBH90008.1 putative HTH-type transcriptional regulator YdeP [Thermosporothrix sp. COM3]GCE48209.1 putative HTH-type transcriptional regulator YdeP [Thermosporothrix hazakensis]
MPYEHSLYGCPVDATLNVISGKWKPQILRLLFQGTRRFGVLQRSIPGISRHVLTTQLRELEQDGIIQRTVFAEVPPKVEYSLTEFGKTLEPVLTGLLTWGEHYIQQQDKQKSAT